MLSLPVTELKGVGPAMAKRLKLLGLNKVKDLLFDVPFRYEDFSTTKPLSDLQDGDEVTVRGTIELIANKRSARKRVLLTEALLGDESGKLRVVWFNQGFLSKALKPGDEVFLSGKITRDYMGTQMVGPSYEKIPKGEDASSNSAKILPMYHLTSGLTQKQRRNLSELALPVLDEVEEWLPNNICTQAKLMNLSDALRAIHFPADFDAAKSARRRLAFDELFILQLRAERQRQSVKAATAVELNFHEEKIKKFVTDLPFTLTKDQKVSAWEILQDIARPTPMNRLLEGDVGSGKTVVAALAAHNAVLAGAQVAIMAPTDILATQHFKSFTQMLGTHHSVALLTRTKYKIANAKMPDKSQKGNKQFVIDQLGEGKIDLIIGTHALLTEDVHFKNLGLVVIDEQHRFGVAQRRALKDKTTEPGYLPHFLSMTATPIPRSFALTLYGELDLSMIKQMPSGRKAIQTKLVNAQRRADAYTFIKAQVKQGRQVFVICPLIDEQDSKDDEHEIITGDEKKSVLAEYEKLSKEIFPDLRVDYLHGKMKPKEKDEHMNKFIAGDTDVLVSTSVVEVGVDIPNASVMMIEDAERFGLAQLHQFRGRVGRSEHQSYCFIFSESNSENVRERLEMFETTTDGFALAEYDLERRGPGEVYGRVQSGKVDFKIASLQDTELIKTARELSRGIDFTSYPLVVDKLDEFERGVHLE